MIQAARTHRGLSGLLLGGLLVRVAAEVAYRPALFYSDSWGYLKMAHGSGIVGVAPTRPSGYPLIIRVLTLAGQSLVALITVQHLAGLATGVVLYVLLVGLGIDRRLAAAGTGLVLLDAYAIALEQHVLAEAFFTLTVLASLTLLALRASCPRALAASGLLLATAATMRPVALFVAPVWLLYVALGRPGARSLVIAGVSLIMPLLVYCALHASLTGTFGLTQSDGWFLYGRIGQIVNCDHLSVSAEARPLCAKVGGRSGENPNYFIFNRRSPARLALGGISADSHRQAHTNSLLRRFAVQMIVAHPGAYLRLAGRDFLRFFEPRASSRGDEDRTVALPRHIRLSREDRSQRRGLSTAYAPHDHPPAALLHAYAEVLHTPRWLIGLLTLTALAGVALGGPRRRPTALLVASGLAMLIGSAATAAFALRYLLPAVPLLAAAGVLGGADLAAWIRARVYAQRLTGTS